MNKRIFLLALTIIFAVFIITACSNQDNENGEQNSEEASSQSDENNEGNQANEKEQNDENGTVLTELHSYEDDDDADVENISINYDGSVVFFREMDESGEDEEVTPYFIYDNELIDASSIDTYSNCSFYSIDEKNTFYFTGTCYDADDERVSVVYDVTNDTITHSADSNKILTALADGRVLSIDEYDNDGVIYELTEDGEEAFLEMDDMTTVLGISADQENEKFFIDGANDDFWNSYIYETENDSDPVLFKEVPDDDNATTVEGEISPDGQYIMYRYRGVSGGEHYNYVDSYIFDRESEEEIHLGHGFDINFVRPNGYVFDEVREYGQVVFNIDSSKWLGPDEKDFSFIESLYANEYIEEEEGNTISGSKFMGISGDGETVLVLDRFKDIDKGDNYKIQTIKTEDYIHSLEDQDVEIDFEPSPFNEKGA
ncbi:hypothetical protein ACDX78_16160 [Virgibacillus oceani]